MLEHETDLVKFTDDGLHQLVLTLGQSIKKKTAGADASGDRRQGGGGVESRW